MLTLFSPSIDKLRLLFSPHFTRAHLHTTTRLKGRHRPTNNGMSPTIQNLQNGNNLFDSRNVSLNEPPHCRMTTSPTNCNMSKFPQSLIAHWNYLTWHKDPIVLFMETSTDLLQGACCLRRVCICLIAHHGPLLAFLHDELSMSARISTWKYSL